jgi:hypothetical protein
MEKIDGEPFLLKLALRFDEGIEGRKGRGVGYTSRWDT